MTDASPPCRAVRLRDQLRRTATRADVDLRPLWRGQALAHCADQPITIQRARALEAVLEQVALPIRADDLLVGASSGAWADALPPGVDQATYERFSALNAALGERTFITNSDHIAVDYDKLLRVGLNGLLSEAVEAQARYGDAPRRAFLASVQIALRAAQRYAERYAVACDGAADDASGARAAELRGMAANLRAIASGAPTTMAMALQLVWLVHTIFALEGRGAMAFGRMDQYLLPFYQQAVAAGEEATARQFLECLWAKMEEPRIPNPIQNIAIGGQTPAGEDATNALSYLLLQVTGAVGTPCSNLSARFHARTPLAFYRACAALVRSGIGFPAMFNDEVIVPALVNLGLPVADARDYAFVGCIETFLPGRMPPWSDSRVNLLLALERTLRDGCDGVDGVRRGASTGDPRALGSFEQFFHAFTLQVERMVAEHCAAVAARKSAVDTERFTSPFLSAFVADCIARGQDINAGGARYADFHGPAGMGLGSTADALAAVKWFIYDHHLLSWAELLAAMDCDFAGQELLRQRLLRQAPKYGNDDAYVDVLAAEVVRVFTAAVLRERTPAGGRFVPLMAANVSNIPAGQEVGATPDGRHAGEPVSDAASPVFGRDQRGPTAAVCSLTTVDYRPVVGGTVVNTKFAPQTLAGEEGLDAFCALVQTYFQRGGMQWQCNVTGRATLEAARRDPQAYRDLVVRVSGFSALYVTLSDAVQRDILARTEH